ncbi:hypothetical protein [Paenibacillus massiliensis]|uniref:hypothetical protein n=1 Tax=Paenibacillus massiliensis TaxID=225917 RepID=UPI00036F65B7|nr:hypothetical protein [Paenibacillus massiliensis]
MTGPTKIAFTDITQDANEPRTGGVSLLPEEISWPENPDGEKLTLAMHLPARFLNDTFGCTYPEATAISVFTTYNRNTYFLDNIVYHGDPLELNMIKMGFTKVIAHSIGQPRNESEFTVPARAISLGDRIEDEAEASFTGSKLGGSPGYLQNEGLQVEQFMFCIQLYGGDYPEGYNDIFYLSDSVGYLLLARDPHLSNDGGDAGIFFVQCS